MALMHVDFFSSVLGKCVSMDVIIPQTAVGQIGLESVEEATYPTLYLLHGMSDNHTIWQRRTSIERYVSSKNIAVVMPSSDLAWYTDMACGFGNYFTFISKELPAICRGFFPRMSRKREETWVAGLSMGGYGALKTALWESETFGKTASLSGSFDIEAKPDAPYWNAIFGAPETREKNTVRYAADKLISENRPMPEIYIACGTDDALIGCNRSMRNELSSLGFSVTYKEAPGWHSWEFWDAEIQPIIEKFTSEN